MRVDTAAKRCCEEGDGAVLTCLEPATKKTSSACMDLERRVPRKSAKNAFCAAAFRTSTSGTCTPGPDCHFCQTRRHT